MMDVDFCNTTTVKQKCLKFTGLLEDVVLFFVIYSMIVNCQIIRLIDHENHC